MSSPSTQRQPYWRSHQKKCTAGRVICALLRPLTHPDMLVTSPRYPHAVDECNHTDQDKCEAEYAQVEGVADDGAQVAEDGAERSR